MPWNAVGAGSVERRQSVGKALVERGQSVGRAATLAQAILAQGNLKYKWSEVSRGLEIGGGPTQIKGPAF